MTRVTGTDHLLMLLRERLLRTAAGARSNRAAPMTTGLPPIDRLRLPGALEALTDEQRRRAIVHALLLDELGDGIANDAEFRNVLERVMAMIDALPGGAELIDRATANLQAR